MKKVSQKRDKVYLKIAAIAIASIILISSFIMLDAAITISSDESLLESDTGFAIPERRPEVSSVVTHDGIWVEVDGSNPGTLAEANAVISDTTGITIVADFPGFLIQENYTGTGYDKISIPGTTYIPQEGKPMLPRLIRYVEIPHDIDVYFETIYGVPEVFDRSNILPVSKDVVSLWNVTEPDTLVFDDVYTVNATFPSYNVSLEGGLADAAIIMRGRRLLEVSLYPIQYNPASGELLFYPKFVVKMEYNEPAQIEPVKWSLRSEPFEKLYEALLLNYNPWGPITGELLEPPSSSDISFGLLPENYLTYQPPILSPNFPVDPFVFQFTPASNGETYAEYLIITHPSFVEQTERLAAWKTQKGLLTRVITTLEIDNDYPSLNLEDSIKMYIQEAYDTWSIGPTYVLLFGDSEFVPNGYGMVHKGTTKIDSSVIDNNGVEPNPTYYIDESQVIRTETGSLIDDAGLIEFYFHNQETGRIGTDLFYFTVHGDDYIPDIIYGRISVDDLDQAEVIVNKILAYEQSPPMSPDFYNSILSAAYFDDKEIKHHYDDDEEKWKMVRDGKEEWKNPYISIAENLRHYLIGDTSDLSYDVAMNYSAKWEPNLDTTGGVNSIAYRFPQPWSFFDVAFSDIDGCSHLDQFDGWIPSWRIDPMTGNITLSINDGKFFVYYAGHGDSLNMVYPFDRELDETELLDQGYFEGWIEPRYTGTYAQDLHNEFTQPLIISMACSTGWFDGEIDGENNGVMGARFEDVSVECFLEDITRMSGGGALAAIGSSRVSYANTSGILLNGIAQAFWPGYRRWYNRPIYEMGAALLFGKFNVAFETGYADGGYEYSNTTFQEYHLFGDPETQLWTRPPSDLTVSYPTNMSDNGQQRFVVTVMNQTDPVYYAKVCIQGEDVYQVGYTNSYGQAVFSINPISTEPINVTVTKHNFIPHRGSMDVIHCNALLTLSTYQAGAGERITFTDEYFGGSDIRLIYNETVLEIHPPDELETEQYFVVPEGRDGYANIRVSDSIEVSLVFFKHYRSGPGPDPYIYCQWDSSTWHLHPDGIHTYDNPSIKMYYEDDNGVWQYVDRRNLLIHENYKIEVNVSNADHATVDAENVEVTVEFSPFGAGGSWQNVDSSGEATIIQEPIEPGGWNIAEVFWEPDLTGHICIRARVFHINDENTYNNFGQENTDVSYPQSPAESHFQVGNPVNGTNYLQLEIRQQGDYEDIWKAELRGYSYEALPTNSSDMVSLWVTVPDYVEEGTSRLFTVVLYINGEYTGGLSVNVTKRLTDWVLILIIIGTGVVLLIVGMGYFFRKKK